MMVKDMGDVSRVEREGVPDPIWVDDDSTVLVTLSADGTMTVATRPEPGAIWGPPVTVRPR